MTQRNSLNSPFCVVFNTCPDKETAVRVANTVVQEKLAACVNIIPGITSIYPWEGNIETGEEVLLFIKTRSALYPELENRLRELHPYELPEIINVSISSGLEAYLGWITDSVKH